MPPARSRPSRPDAARPDSRRADPDGRAWEDARDVDAPDDDAGGAPLLALVDAAADAGELDVRALAEAFGFGAVDFRLALASPSRLTRAQLDRLATLLGVDRSVVRAAVAATRQPGVDVDPAEREPVAAAEPEQAAGAGVEAELTTESTATTETTESDPGVSSAVPALPVVESSPAPAAPTEPATAGGPRSVVELLERTIAAVADDALGRRVRLAILATAQTAAAEAGRAAPAELRELRRRVQTGDLPWVGEGAIVLDERTSAADDAVLAAASSLVRQAQRAGTGYADLFAPVHDDALGDLLRRLTVSVRAAALGPTSACVVTPPLYGRYLLVCSAEAAADQRRVALRRGLAHVLAGHVGEMAPLPLPAPPDAERLADLFALADLVPFWQLDDWRRQGRLGWRAVTAAVAQTARALAGDWTDERAQDRAMLRVRLYRAHRI